jgi:hypothetical protein
MPALATLSTADGVLPLRVRYRQEMNCQIVHDSIHRRDGWTRTYICTADGAIAGFGCVAIAGPWQDKPTVFEFYVVPEHRARARSTCSRRSSQQALRASWKFNPATPC